MLENKENKNCLGVVTGGVGRFGVLVFSDKVLENDLYCSYGGSDAGDLPAEQLLRESLKSFTHAISHNDPQYEAEAYYNRSKALTLAAVAAKSRSAGIRKLFKGCTNGSNSILRSKVHLVERIFKENPPNN